MENRNQKNQGRNQDQKPNQGSPEQTSSRNTSHPGREEEVVNEQEQQRVTNTDRGDTTNRESEGTRREDTGRGNTGRGDSGMNRESGVGKEGRMGTEEERTAQKRDTESESRRGKNQDVPDVGRDDAEKTRRESPKM